MRVLAVLQLILRPSQVCRRSLLWILPALAVFGVLYGTTGRPGGVSGYPRAWYI